MILQESGTSLSQARVWLLNARGVRGRVAPPRVRFIDHQTRRTSPIDCRLILRVCGRGQLARRGERVARGVAAMTTLSCQLKVKVSATVPVCFCQAHPLSGGAGRLWKFMPVSSHCPHPSVCVWGFTRIHLRDCQGLTYSSAAAALESKESGQEELWPGLAYSLDSPQPARGEVRTGRGPGPESSQPPTT